MNQAPKLSNIQIFRLMAYNRALHPELFEVQERQVQRIGDYEVESWLIRAGHVVRFHHAGEAVTEAVIEDADHLPENGLIHALPCLGEKDYEWRSQGKLFYVTTIQTENLTENLYLATLREMRDVAAETDAMVHEWDDGEGVTCLSMLDAQRYKREYHIQSYHLLGATGVVLRTQSIFEIKARG